MQLTQIPALTPHLDALAALGFETLEELAGAVDAAAPELTDYLGTDVVALLANVPMAAAAIAPATLATMDQADYELGVELDMIPRMTIAPFRFQVAAALPPRVTHVARMPPIRNQARRGSCVAFATLAAYEHRRIVAGQAQTNLSEQFQYWNCKRSDSIPQQEGTWLGISYPLLRRDGVCNEPTWPYQPNPIIGNVGQGPPPPGAQLRALANRPPRVTQLSPTNVADLKAALAGGHCVSFSVPVFNSWYRSRAVAATGNITMPIPGEVRAGGHAMCLVGYIDGPTQQAIGGGRFILRNSWGASWAVHSPHGAGYGTIPYAYLAAHGAEAWFPG